jgi:adenosylmethionine-8-amino-7-oxononanoate aminotransferase
MITDLQKIIKSDQDHLFHPLFHPNDQKEPFVWVKGEGATLYTADGREFIDGLSCLWNVNVGHGRKELAQAAARQMEQLAFASGYTGNTSIPAVELGEKLSSLCYPSINHFFFTSGGGESNDSAIKTARFFWISQGRTEKIKIISREHGYHGATIGSVSATAIPAYWPMFGGRLPDFVSIPPLEADLLEEAILKEGPDTVAAFIAEPVQGAGGLRPPSEGYFPRIREICDKYDVLLIADEVITGFGRTGRWFALEHWKIQPDMLSFAKGITSGYLPLGGIGLSDRVFRALTEAPPERRWMHAYTYSGHPTCCAVALVNLDIIEREGLVEAAARKGKKLLDGLRQLSSLDVVGDVRGLGLMAGVEFAGFTPSQKFGARVQKECYKRGLVSRIRDDIYMLAPPLVISDEQIDRMVNILGEAIPAALKQ